MTLILINRPKLKNVDRSTAQQLAITVGNVTVIITDFKEKTRSSSTSSSTVTSSAASEQQHPSSGSESMDKSSSRASTPKRDLSLGHDESFWAFKLLLDTVEVLAVAQFSCALLSFHPSAFYYQKKKRANVCHIFYIHTNVDACTSVSWFGDNLISLDP